MPKRVRKNAENCVFSVFYIPKGHNSHKNWRKLTTLELDLQYSKTKSYAKFQLNMSKHVGEKCGKLLITYILSSKRGITPSKIGAKWRHSNLICSTFKQSDVQNFSSICQSMYEKSVENGRTETRTDGRRVGWTESRTETRTDGHHHTIIRPVWRQAYNKNELNLIDPWRVYNPNSTIFTWHRKNPVKMARLDFFSYFRRTAYFDW